MPSEHAELVRHYHPLLRSLNEHPAYAATVATDVTAAGRVLDLAEAPSGVLVLARGEAVLEAAGRRGARPRPRGKFEFAGTSGLTPRLEPGVARQRLGRCDWVLVGGRPPLNSNANARIFCTTECEWFFIPTAPTMASVGVEGTDPLARSLRQQRSLQDADFLLQLTRFAPLRHLSYDAVRLLSYFFDVRTYHPGEVVLAGGDEARPTLVLEGALTGPGGTVPAGSVLFEELFRPGAATPSIAADFVAHGRTVTAELPLAAFGDLLPLDDRIVARHDLRWERQWNVVVGDPDEDAPDAQTIAFNLAAREGSEDGPLSPAISVLLIDAGGAQLEARAGSTGWPAIPIVATMAPPPPAHPLWPGRRVTVVALDPTHFTTEAEVQKLVKETDLWVQGAGKFDKVIVRIPRAGPQWAPVIARAIAVDVITDDLMDPLPEWVGTEVDVVRIARPRSGVGFRTASHTPFITLPRDPKPTTEFWQTGQPWSA